MYVALPTDTVCRLKRYAGLTEIDPDPAYILGIYVRSGDIRLRENAVDIACVFKYFASSHLNFGFTFRAGPHTAPAVPAFAPEAKVGFKALNRTGFVADEPPAFVSTQWDLKVGGR